MLAAICIHIFHVYIGELSQDRTAGGQLIKKMVPPAIKLYKLCSRNTKHKKLTALFVSNGFSKGELQTFGAV